ncbi:MAG: 3-phosphoshikimate 1-carboxyvinyltransferase [Myxococcota bacterium]|jgi:3-phosphoshikimate 1-carboxyvinyltransferase
MPNLTVLLPGCKSTTQRSLICAVMGDKKIVLQGVSDADDCRQLRLGLQALGASIGPAGETHAWLIEGCAGDLPIKQATIDCQDGGTTFRFLLAICATQAGVYTLQVSKQLARRPHSQLFEVLREMNVDITEVADGWVVDSRNWRACDVSVDCDISSQFLSALTLSQVFNKKFVASCSSKEASLPYYKLTQKVIADFAPPIASYAIPGDFSAAMYFAGLAIVREKDIEFTNGCDTQHPEKYALGFLQDHFGLQVAGKSISVRPNVHKPTATLRYDVQCAPDASLLIAAVCRVQKVAVQFVNSEVLRYKESDRLVALESLEKCETEIDSCNDHRVVMAAAVLQLQNTQLRVNDSECVSKSFPNFFKEWSSVN